MNSAIPATCLFCDSDADSREHLFPDWLNDVLGYVHPTLLFSGDREWKADRPASHKLRVVCQRCNNGWMSRIEKNAQPVLTPLILGQGHQIGSDQQAMLARWAYSRAVVGEQLAEWPDDQRIPEGHRLWLPNYNEPPLSVEVFAGTTDGQWWMPVEGQVGNVHFSQTKMIANEDQRDPVFAGDRHLASRVAADPLVGYSATILIRHLALQVVGSLVEGASFNYPHPLKSYLTRIWPVGATIDWPSKPAMDRPVVEALIAVWRGDAPLVTPWAAPERVEALANMPNRKARRAAARAQKRQGRH